MIDEPIIPYYISKLAIQYSIPFIFLASFISTVYRQYIIGILLFIVYITSNLFWRHITSNGIIRHIDTVCVIITFAYATLIITYYFPNIKKYWYLLLKLTISVFIINEILFFIGIKYCDKTYKIFIYYNVVIIHMIFIHIIPTVTWIYYVITQSPGLIE
jgi:hypothetical protein